MIDRKQVRNWAEQRGGRPSVARTIGIGGVLRFDVGEKAARLDEIGGDEFFKIFDDSELAFLHQGKTHDGHVSRFLKFFRRESAGSHR